MSEQLIQGIVEQGKRIGRQLGFPTANIYIDDALSVEDGVYRSRVELRGKLYDAMSYVGRRPTLQGTRRSVESTLFGFEGDIYGERIEVELHERVRGDMKFGSLDELKAQIAKDKERIMKIINKTE